MSITVRQAVASDVFWLIPQARDFAAGFGSETPIWPGDGQAAQFIGTMIETQPFFVAVTAEGEGVGFLMAMLVPHYFNPSITTLTELAWWVEPDHRGSSAGARLLAAFTAYGAEVAQWSVMSLEETSPVSDASLAKRGFHRYERTYLRENVC